MSTIKRPFCKALVNSHQPSRFIIYDLMDEIEAFKGVDDPQHREFMINIRTTLRRDCL